MGWFFSAAWSRSLQSATGPKQTAIEHNSFRISVAFLAVRLYILLTSPKGLIATRTGW
jgi:hypothetical protein